MNIRPSQLSFSTRALSAKMKVRSSSACTVRRRKAPSANVIFCADVPSSPMPLSKQKNPLRTSMSPGWRTFVATNARPESDGNAVTIVWPAMSTVS